MPALTCSRKSALPPLDMGEPSGRSLAISMSSRSRVSVSSRSTFLARSAGSTIDDLTESVPPLGLALAFASMPPFFFGCRVSQSMSSSSFAGSGSGFQPYDFWSSRFTNDAVSPSPVLALGLLFGQATEPESSLGSALPPQAIELYYIA